MSGFMEGPLSKWTNVMQGWQYRWFVLDENVCLLSYYTSKEKMKRGSRRGCVRLKGAVLGIDDEDESTFTITTQDQKTFHFQARDGDERQKWMDALEEAISRAFTSKGVSSKHVPSSASFDKKLSETDAYLQMLISQVENLEAKIEACPDEKAKEKYSVIKVTAESMIESVKRAIVMMQLAKPRLSPERHEDGEDIDAGVKAPADAPVGDKRHPPVPTTALAHTRNIPNKNLPSAGDNLVDVRKEQATPPSDKGADYEPLNSYSSSEGEDDFYDAFENSAHSNRSNEDGATGEIDEANLSSSPPVITSQNDVFDELYDDGEEDKLESLDAHGSIIRHLLSQVRIGMDLTKIVLPTFILERRSLLEMFADFFSHPDFFVRAGDYSTPEERITEVMRWYMSAFHAGRKSSVAKKPYNPIIGETFQCFWEVPGVSSADSPKAEDGPVQWTTKSHLCYIAEQVSHHPPISAFYAECPDKNISLDGYIWTKSKFLGLSIGVHMVGQAVISLLDHGEEYKVTFPSAYGRSILTVPWIELGGKCNITCEKTGYSATVDFLTKPFYGGKTNQIKGQVFEPGNSKPTCVATGEWNGVIWAEYSTGRSEVFCDTTRLPIMKKSVKPISEQEPFESRRLWKDVTLNLKKKDVQEATKYKQMLEQRQREEAKQRAETGEPIHHKHFQEVGEHWVYTRPLVNRFKSTSLHDAEEPDVIP